MGSFSLQSLQALSKETKLKPASPSLNLPRSPERPAGCCSRVLTIFQDLHAVNEDVSHPDCILVRVFKRRPIGNGLRIEYHDIGEHALFDEATTLQPEIRGR